MLESHAEKGWASDAPTPAQLAEFFAQIKSGRITRGKLQALIRGKRSTEEWLKDWAEHYKKFYGITCDFSSLRVPVWKPGFDRLIVMAKGITCNRAYEVCAANFPSWRYTDDLDAAVLHHDRPAKDGAYAIWIRDRQEADEELKNLSADMLRDQKTPCIALPERIVLEPFYFDETGEHLDVNNWTLCGGSRGSDVGVPHVHFSGDKFRVSWLYSFSRGDDLRGRAVVS